MRLIDADALKESVKQQCDYCSSIGLKKLSGIFQEALFQEIDNAPTIEDRKKGEWIIEPHDVKNDIWAHRCGVCLKVTMLGGHKPRFDFCPNCGAVMRGDSNG